MRAETALEDDYRRAPQSPAGEPEAFDGLVREHQRMIHSLCYRMTGSLAEADDLAQETFLQAYRHWAEFRAESRFSSWLYRIAVNQCLNWRKRVQRQTQLLKEWSAQEQDQAGDESARTKLVQEALLRLDPKQRAAIILTIYDGLTHAEAAQILGCSETTVSWRLFAARRKLKRVLRQMPPTEPGS